MELALKDLTSFMLNWGTYEQLVHEEIWFVTRIYWGYFHKWALDSQAILDAWIQVNLVKDPTNKHDANATEVRSQSWDFLGFLRKEIAAEISDVSNFKVQVKTAYDWNAKGKRNEVGTEIIIVNLSNFKAFNEANKKDKE